MIKIHKPLSITKGGVNKNLKKIQSKNYKKNFYNCRTKKDYKSV